MKINLEPALDIDVAHLVTTEEGVIFKNHLQWSVSRDHIHKIGKRDLEQSL